MSGAASLVNAVINLAALREHARKELIDVLDSVCAIFLCIFFVLF